MNKGKLIVLDGIDGSGKATQTKLLAERLRRAGFSVETIAFPRHGNESACFIKKYLSGHYGDPDQVDPYQASLFYALDRYDASGQIRDWLNQGKIVIADRYVSANMGHQGGKISNPLERKLFFDWLYRLEYEILNIPRPDLNIFLHLDSALARGLIDGRGGASHDLHEKNDGHLKRAEETFLEIARTYPDFVIIECAARTHVCSPEEINNLIWQQAESRLIGKRKMLIEKISPNALAPKRAEHDQPLFDLFSLASMAIPARQTADIKTGLKIYLPENCLGLIIDHPLNLRKDLIVSKKKVSHGPAPEIIVSLTNLNYQPVIIAAGQKIAQLLIIG